MIDNQDIISHLQKMGGENVEIKESPKSEEERTESLFVDTILTLESAWDADNSLHGDYGVDLMGFTTSFYHTIENLLVLQYGHSKAEIIWWWVVDRFDAGGELLGIETEDGKPHILETPKQLYEFLKTL
jgi:hypothetical protein|tara:strand:- start:91 stop:477 length:387 start_codon:yes stop_codon:yes gene_type:complete